jgi:hypothetical protein
MAPCAPLKSLKRSRLWEDAGHKSRGDRTPVVGCCRAARVWVRPRRPTRPRTFRLGLGSARSYRSPLPGPRRARGSFAYPGLRLVFPPRPRLVRPRHLDPGPGLGKTLRLAFYRDLIAISEPGTATDSAPLSRTLFAPLKPFAAFPMHLTDLIGPLRNRVGSTLAGRKSTRLI